MSSNLDYLDPALRPLEDKVNDYLAAEKELRRAEQEALELPLEQARETAVAQQFEQRPPTGSFPQHAEQVQQQLENLRDDLARLRHEILEMLPARNEWIKLNLGYGPSRVGAFHVAGTPDEYELRVIH